jgi:putative Holliday junction resolvase
MIQGCKIMRVLGIDLGIKRTGLALSDELGLSVKLLPNLQANSRSAAVAKILAIVKDAQVKVVLIGLPETKSDHSKAVVSRAIGLESELSRLFESLGLAVQVLLRDESYSSKQGAQSLVASGVKKSQRKGKLDAAAAAILVEEYLRGLS